MPRKACHPGMGLYVVASHLGLPSWGRALALSAVLQSELVTCCKEATLKSRRWSGESPWTGA